MIISKNKKKFLIIGGDEDMITPKDDTLFLSKIFKDSKLIIIKKCGHLSSMEKPLITYKYLKGFFNLSANKFFFFTNKLLILA